MPTAPAERTRRAVWPLLALLRLYRLLVSPLLGPRCRHLPTCSEYAAEALRRHGLWRGGRLAAWRLLRCQPWGTSGYDPVPPA
jgi:putative membrane protein insertion efficiency factor